MTSRSRLGSSTTSVAAAFAMFFPSNSCPCLIAYEARFKQHVAFIHNRP